jgi:hypothetical protein
MNKSIRILLIVFVALIALYFLFFRSKERESTEKIDAKLFVADSSKIDKLEIVKNNETIVLEKINGQWNVTKPVNYPADTNAVYPMLKDLKNFMIESTASENPEKFNTYLDSVHNTKISTYQEGKLLGTFILGKIQGMGNAFIKKPEENRILLASNILPPNFTKSLKDYRYKLIMALSPFQINKIEFKSTDSNKVDFIAAKDSVNKWHIGGDTVASASMEGFLNMFSALLAEDFMDTPLAPGTVPTYTITLNVNNQPTVINLFKEAGTEPATYICQVSGIQQLFKFNQGMAGQLMKKRKDFIPDPPKKEEPKKETPK